MRSRLDGHGAVTFSPAALSALKRRLRRNVSGPRFAHSLGVARLAAELAPAAGVDPDRAYVAGLLHDCARGLPLAGLRRILQSYAGRHLDAAIWAEPRLWHDPAASYLARHRYGIRDPGILRAVARHSTGGPSMHPLDQIIFVADFCEPNRTLPAAARVRALARRDLRAAVKMVLADKLGYLAAAKRRPHPRSLALAKELGIKIKGEKH